MYAGWRVVLSVIFFIDESGQPHPSDSAARPVLAALGFPLAKSRELTRSLYAIKRTLFGDVDPRAEAKLKAHRILNERTFRRIPEKWQYVEAVFDLCNSLPFVTFAMVMERPRVVLETRADLLPPQYCYLLQRVNVWMTQNAPDRYALLVFDSRDPKGDIDLSDQLGRFLHRTDVGRT